MVTVFLQKAVHVTGTVEDAGPGGRHATIRFQLPSGEPVGFIGGGSFVPVQPGQVVPVAYDPADPVRSAALDQTVPLWFPAVLTGLIGSGLLVVSRAGQD